MRSSLAAKANRLEFPLIEERHNILLDEPQNIQLEGPMNACLSSMIVIGTRRMTHSNRPSPRNSLLRLRSSAVKWPWLRASSTAPLAYPLKSSGGTHLGHLCYAAFLISPSLESIFQGSSSLLSVWMADLRMVIQFRYLLPTTAWP